MPRFRTETFTAGDLSWLASGHGLWNGRTETVDISAFTAATHYADGILPSGTPVALVAGVLVPYDKTEATVTGAGILAGFLLNAHQITTPGASVTGPDFAAAVLDHGRVKSSRLPHAFVAPVAAAKKAASSFIYITGGG